MFPCSTRVDHAEAFQPGVGRIFRVEKAFGIPLSRWAKAFRAVVGHIRAARQARAMVERQSDIAFQTDCADLKITRRTPQDAATGGVAGIHGVLNCVGVHRDSVADGTLALNVKQLGLCRFAAGENQRVVVLAERNRRLNDEQHAQVQCLS